MEIMDALEDLPGSNDHRRMILRGRRTKRQRQLSSCSSSGGGESGCSEVGEGIHLYSLMRRPSSTSTDEISTSTEEDEDMAANCLILLARGGCIIKREQDDHEVKNTEEKLMNISTRINGTKASFYAYECKTCNRTFPSFQALGGHRASHKKPKAAMVEEKKPIFDDQQDHQGEEEEKGRFNRLISTSDRYHNQAVMNSNKGNNNNNNKLPKIHECSICGSEFSSGQALGGHMRRHRNPTTSSSKVITNINNDSSSDHNIDHSNSEKPRNIFPLDLNLPAPEDDHRADLKFQFAAANQQHLVFSAPALVDCHY